MSSAGAVESQQRGFQSKSEIVKSLWKGNTLDLYIWRQIASAGFTISCGVTGFKGCLRGTPSVSRHYVSRKSQWKNLGSHQHPNYVTIWALIANLSEKRQIFPFPTQRSSLEFFQSWIWCSFSRPLMYFLQSSKDCVSTETHRKQMKCF